MVNILHLFQIILDTALLFLCCEGLFRDKTDRRRKDFLLFPLLFLFCMAARVSVIAGAQAEDLFLAKGFEIAPADNLISSLFLMLVVLLMTSIYYKPVSEGYTFCGTMAAFSLYLLLRTVSIVILFLCRATGNWLLFGCRILSLAFVLLFLYSPALDWLQETIKNGGFLIRLVCTNIAGALIGILAVLSFDIEQFAGRLWGIVTVLVILVLLDSGMLYYNQRKVQEQKRIHLIEQYVPIVEELITQVRARQHEYQNRIFALQTAVYTAGTLKEARQHVAALTTGTMIDSNDQQLLSCDSKIIAGMLYGKVKQAEFSNIHLNIELHGQFKKSAAPETVWIDVIGILLDNAVEASADSDTVYLTSKPNGNYLELAVSNAAPPMSNSEFMHLFKKGVTSKKDPSLHGFGLYNIARITEHYHGKILTRNEQMNGVNYVVFRVLLP